VQTDVVAFIHFLKGTTTGKSI